MYSPIHHDLEGIAAQRFPSLPSRLSRLQPQAARLDAFHTGYLRAKRPFKDCNTALRASAFLQREAKPLVVSEAKDSFRKDDDVCLQLGVPPKGNANFAWVQHFIHHLAA